MRPSRSSSIQLHAWNRELGSINVLTRSTQVTHLFHYLLFNLFLIILRITRGTMADS